MKIYVVEFITEYYLQFLDEETCLGCVTQMAEHNLDLIALPGS